MTDEETRKDRRIADPRVQTIEKAVANQNTLLGRIDERLLSLQQDLSRHHEDIKLLFSKHSATHAEVTELRSELNRSILQITSDTSSRISALETKFAEQKGATDFHRGLFVTLLGTVAAAVLTGVGFLLVGGE